MKKLFLLMAALVLIAGNGLLQAPAARAGSLYEFYADASADTLKKETSEMGKELKKTFSQDNIARNQQKIDFAAYFANLKKAVLYASKLSTYSQYHEDLEFARDNELFKGLPEEPARQDTARGIKERKEFVEEKYERTKLNVEEEINTYVDLLNLSLDTCEAMANNDLSGFLDQPENRRRIEQWLDGEQFAAYRKNAAELGRAWPEIEKRISGQCALWQGKPASPTAPIINAGLVNGL